MNAGDALPQGVYLDYGGFAPTDPRVLAVMRPFLEAGVGNPSAPHSLRAEARAALEAARVTADSVLRDLDLAGIAASTGSACASLTQTPSATLRAIGCAPDELDGPLCFAFGRFTAADVEAVLRHLPCLVSRLRAAPRLARR